MIQTNLHNHTFRCHHATSTDEEYIQQAIAAGYMESFWRIAGEENTRCLIGLDAHQPEVYADANTITEIENYLKGFGLTPEKTVVKPL